VEMLVPIWITLPLKMTVWPSVAVVVKMLGGGEGGGGGGGGGGGEDGGMKVNVWLPVVTVKGAVPVTVGTWMVSVPLMIMTDALDTIGAPAASVQVVAGSVIPIAGVVLGTLVTGGRPIVVPAHVVKVTVVFT